MQHLTAGSCMHALVTLAAASVSSMSAASAAMAGAADTASMAAAAMDAPANVLSSSMALLLLLTLTLLLSRDASVEDAASLTLPLCSDTCWQWACRLLQHAVPAALCSSPPWAHALWAMPTRGVVRWQTWPLAPPAWQ